MTHPVSPEQYIKAAQQETLQVISAPEHPEFETSVVLPQEGIVKEQFLPVVLTHVHVVRGESGPLLRRFAMSETGISSMVAHLALQPVAHEGDMNSKRLGDGSIRQSVQAISDAAHDSAEELGRTGEIYETIGISQVGITGSGEPVFVHHTANKFSDRVAEHAGLPDEVDHASIPEDSYRLVYAKYAEHTTDIAPYDEWIGEFRAGMTPHGPVTARQLGAGHLHLLLNPAHSHPTVESRLFQ